LSHEIVFLCKNNVEWLKAVT